MKRISQSELARRLSVSQGTISGVLNGNPSIRVSEETRKRILEALEEADYHPNMLANALRGRETKTVGIIYQGGHVQLGVQKLEAVITDLTERGYLPLVYDLLLGVDGRAQCRLLCDMNVDGVILINASEPFIYDVYPQYLEGKIRTVSIDSPWMPPIYQIYSDRVQGFRLLTQHLIRLGYKRIASLSLKAHPRTVDSPYTQTFGMQQGIDAALKEAGLKLLANEIHDSDRDSSVVWRNPYQVGVGLMARLLESGHRPDAVIASSDSWAIGAMRECMRRGLRIPQDIAIVGFNDDLQSAYAASPLTTVAPDVSELARYAVDAIVHPRKKRASPIMSSCELVVRESCGFPQSPIHTPL